VSRYTIVRRFGSRPGTEQDAAEPLDHVSDGDERFGSYQALAHDPRFRYRGIGCSDSES
jgi:hypothetical protein